MATMVGEYSFKGVFTGLSAAFLLAAFVSFSAQAQGESEGEAEPVRPLRAEDCDKVRQALEGGLPFGPGFRRIVVDIPKNKAGIKGQVCRLLTLGTGIHMEGPKVPTLAAMIKLVQSSLFSRGWTVTDQTLLFSESSAPGRQVAALYRNNSICVTTVVIDMVKGITLSPNAVKDGKVRLSALKPHQREWWISVDCFSVKPKEKPAAKPDKGGEQMPPMMGKPGGEEVVPDPDAPAEPMPGSKI